MTIRVEKVATPVTSLHLGLVFCVIYVLVTDACLFFVVFDVVLPCGVIVVFSFCRR